MYLLFFSLYSKFVQNKITQFVVNQIYDNTGLKIYLKM